MECTRGGYQNREVQSVTAVSAGCAVQILGGWGKESGWDWGSGLGYIRPIFSHNYHQKTKTCTRKMTAKEERLYSQTSFRSQSTQAFMPGVLVVLSTRYSYSEKSLNRRNQIKENPFQSVHWACYPPLLTATIVLMWELLKHSLQVARICQPLTLISPYTHISADSQGTSLTLSGKSSSDASNLHQNSVI